MPTMRRAARTLLVIAVLGCNGHRGTAPSPSPARAASGDAATELGVAVGAGVTWTPTDRRPDDHEFVAFPYLDRLVDDGVPCADAFDLAPHDERVADSPHGAVALGSGVFRRGCFSRNLLKGFLLDRRPALVGCFQAATPGVAAAATVRTYWVAPDRYDEAPRLLARVDVLHARGRFARAIDDGARPQELAEDVEHEAFTLLDAARVELHRHHVPENVDDEPGQTVALAVHETKGVCLGVGQAELLTVLQSALQSLTEERGVDSAVFVREQTNGYRGRVAEEAAPEHAALRLDDGDLVPCARVALDFGDGLPEHPGVAAVNWSNMTRLEEHPCHGGCEP